MADIPRTKATLAVALADNTTGDISPQDLRDFMESMHLGYGGLYFATPAATTIGGAGTLVKAAGTTVSAGSNRWTAATTNRLAYDSGEPSVTALICASATLQVATAAAELTIGIAENGTIIAATEQSVDAQAAGESVNVTAFALVAAAASDYYELWVANEDATDDVTVVKGYMFALGLFT
jgi:hypothetical protein